MSCLLIAICIQKKKIAMVNNLNSINTKKKEGGGVWMQESIESMKRNILF